MQCDFCGAQAANIKKATKSFGRSSNLVIIENIPIVHCSRWLTISLTDKPNGFSPLPARSCRVGGTPCLLRTARPFLRRSCRDRPGRR